MHGDASDGPPLRPPTATNDPTLRAAPLTPDHDARISILLVTDIRLYGEGLTQFLRAQPNIDVLATVPSSAMEERVRALQPDVVLIDSSQRKALDGVGNLRAQVPDAKLIVFAVGESDDDLMCCIEAGASGYVPRSGTLHDLLAAVESAVRSEALCSPREVALLFNRLARRARPSTSDEIDARLSRREHEVVVLIDRGLSNKQIAQALHIGLATVKNHVHNVLEKLRVTRRAEAAARLRSGSRTSMDQELPLRTSDELRREI
jgi:DNA-binding NarL/FixJ family response regulator